MIGDHRVSLDCLSLTAASFADLILSAGAAGFDLVSLWLNPAAAFPAQWVGPDDETRCAELLSQCGIGVHQIEAFDLRSPEEMAAYRPHFARGAELGARTVLFYCSRADGPRSLAASLRAACAMAADHGLTVNLEPVSFAGVRHLRDAQAAIEDAGVDAGLVLDVLHFVRAGGRVPDLAAIDAARLRYVQVCDGPLQLAAENAQVEAMLEREVPGRGAFPLQELLGRVPDRVVLGLEVPRHSALQHGTAPAQQARELMAALRQVLASPSGAARVVRPVSGGH